MSGLIRADESFDPITKLDREMGCFLGAKAALEVVSKVRLPKKQLEEIQKACIGIIKSNSTNMDIIIGNLKEKIAKTKGMRL